MLPQLVDASTLKKEIVEGVDIMVQLGLILLNLGFYSGVIFWTTLLILLILLFVEVVCFSLSVLLFLDVRLHEIYGSK